MCNDPNKWWWMKKIEEGIWLLDWLACIPLWPARVWMQILTILMSHENSGCNEHRPRKNEECSSMKRKMEWVKGAIFKGSAERVAVARSSGWWGGGTAHNIVWNWGSHWLCCGHTTVIPLGKGEMLGVSHLIINRQTVTATDLVVVVVVIDRVGLTNPIIAWEKVLEHQESWPVALFRL